jgi:hypothetical protein
MEYVSSEADRRKCLSRVVREIARAEQAATEHAARESRRLGEATPPAEALRTIAQHAEALQPRFHALVSGYDITAARGGLGAALANLRDLVVDRIVQGERAYRIALVDLRHGVDAVSLFRAASREDQLLGLIRWCDDWLSSRRPLVALAERALSWFSETPALTDADALADIEAEILGARLDGPAPSGDRPSSHDHR